MTLSRVRVAVLAALMAFVVGLVAYLVVGGGHKPEDWPIATYSSENEVERDRPGSGLHVGLQAVNLTRVGDCVVALTDDGSYTLPVFPVPETKWTRHGIEFSGQNLDPPVGVHMHGRSLRTYDLPPDVHVPPGCTDFVQHQGPRTRYFGASWIIRAID